MRSNLLPEVRRKNIERLVIERGSLRIDEICSKFDISEITARRDLNSLEERGRIERTHGGAVAIRMYTSEVVFSEKGEKNKDQKSLIARAALFFVEEGDTIFINSGSTTYEFMKHLARYRNIRIITNNGALLFSNEINASIIMTGGRLRFNTRCFVGEVALNMLSTVNASKAFIGADGITPPNGVTSPSEEEAAVTRKMVRQTVGKVTLLADESKIGRISPFKIVGMEEIDNLVTVGNIDDVVQKEMQTFGVGVYNAEKVVNGKGINQKGVV